MPLITTFRGCTNPSSIPEPLQPNKYASVSSAKPCTPLRPGDCRAANEAQEGASECQGSPRAQRAPSRLRLRHNDDPEGPAPCSQHSCELVLCGFKQQLGSPLPRMLYLLTAGPKCPRPTQAGPSVFTKEIINDVTNWILILTMTQLNFYYSWFPRRPAVERVFRAAPTLPTWEQIFSLSRWRMCAPCGQPHYRTRSLAASPKEPQEDPLRLWTEPVKKRLLPTFFF